MGNKGNKENKEYGRPFRAGYQYLLAWKITVPIYDYTVVFCSRCGSPNFPNYPNLSSKRTFDQMVQSARSGMTNIPEGNTQDSTEGYLKLTGVNRGSLEELLNDYLSFARQNGIEIWGRERSVREIREIGKIWEIIKATPTLPDSPNFPNLPNDPPKAINLLITLINQANYLQTRLKQSVEKKFVEKGGFRERLYRERRNYRENKENRDNKELRGKTLKSLIFFLISPLLLSLIFLPIFSLISLTVPRPAFATNTGRFTISVWVKPTTSIASKAIITKAEELRLTTDASGNPLCQFKTTTWQTAASKSSPIPLDQWTHLICTYDLTKLTVYVNGIAGTPISLTAVPDDTSAVFYAGRDASSGTTYGFFSGLIDEYKFYNYNLTEDEVKVEYNRGAAMQLGTLSSGTGNTAPATAGSQEYCIPGDTVTCSPPVGRWDFNEGVGTSAFDTSGNGNNGGFGAGTAAPTWTSGKVGKGLKFDGSNDFINVADNDSLDLTTAGTFEFWIKNLRTDAAIAFNRILNKKATWNSADGYNVQIHSPGKVYVVGSNTQAASITVLSGGWDTSWHHVAVKFTGGTSVTVYLDGVYKGTGTIETPVVNSANLYIGKLDDSSAFNGLIDQVRIYNYARTPAQIAWDYNRGEPVGHWKFDECQGGIAHDSAADPATGGTREDGTITIGGSGTQTTLGTCSVGTGSTAAWGNGSVGKYNASLNFDGTDDYVSVGNPSSLQLNDPFTIGLWFKQASAPVSYPNLVGHGTGGWSFGISNEAGNVGKVFISQSGQAPYLNSTTVLSNNIWSHLVVTRSGSITKIYVNGVLENTSATSPTFTFANGVRIAEDSTGGGNINGQIDDVKIFNYALTTTQIKTLYNDGAIRFGPVTGTP